jgi:hypothetical protein
MNTGLKTTASCNLIPLAFISKYGDAGVSINLCLGKSEKYYAMTQPVIPFGVCPPVREIVFEVSSVEWPGGKVSAGIRTPRESHVEASRFDET